MKKIVALLLIFVMLFAMYGCGSKETADRKTPAAASVSEFDDAISIEAVEIEPVKGTTRNGVPVVNIKVKLSNNYAPADRKSYADIIVFDLQILGKEGDVLKTLTYTCEEIQKGDTAWTKEQDAIDVSTISGFRVRNYELHVRDRSKTTTMSGSSVFYGLANFIGAGKLSEEAYIPYNDGSNAEAISMKVGSTIKTDTVEIKMSELAFQGSIGIGSGISLGASGDDMILACLRLDITNISKETLIVRNIMDVKVDYNDGFIFNTHDKYCYLVEAEDNDPSVNTFRYDGGASGTEFKLSPLGSDKFVLAIPCAEAVAKDNANPLKVVFTLQNEGHSQNYEYIIR